VQGSYSSYFAYWDMLNMLNMSNNMLQYAKQYAKYAFSWRDLSICLVWVEALIRSQLKAKLRPSSGSHDRAQSSSLITDHRRDSSGWDDCSGTSALLSSSMPLLCNPSFPSHSEIRLSSLQHVLGLDFVALDGPRFVWHLLLRQHSMSLLHGGERQVPEEVVDVSLKALANQWYFLGVFTVLLQPDTRSKLKYAQYIIYSKYATHTRGACRLVAVQQRIQFSVSPGNQSGKDLLY
jgi:hypothetical protein